MHVGTWWRTEYLSKPSGQFSDKSSLIRKCSQASLCPTPPLISIESRKRARPAGLQACQVYTQRVRRKGNSYFSRRVLTALRRYSKYSEICKAGACSLQKLYTCAHLCEHHSWAHGNPAFPAPSGPRLGAFWLPSPQVRAMEGAIPGTALQWLLQVLTSVRCTGPGGAVLSDNTLVMCPSHRSPVGDILVVSSLELLWTRLWWTSQKMLYS